VEITKFYEDKIFLIQKYKIVLQMKITFEVQFHILKYHFLLKKSDFNFYRNYTGYIIMRI